MSEQSEINIFKALDLSNSDKKVIIDACEYDKLSQYTWYLHEDGSACRRKSIKDGSRNNWIERIHREIMGLKKGDKLVVDHKNGDRLDNRRSNLRLCTQRQNTLNSKIRKHSKTQLKGVERSDCKIESYSAYIRYSGKKRSVHKFRTKEDAYEFACLLRDTIHGSFVNHG